MRILISNDDGVLAPGIRALSSRLAQEADHEVFVVAPDRERSTTGHSLTLHKPLRVQEVELDERIKGAWATTGTPSDCVKLAVSQLLDKPPDLVISGINSGPNLGSEVLYSGTVAAAMEGAFMGLISIAVSVMKPEKRYYASAAEVVARFLKVLPKAHLPERALLNINVPACPFEELAGVAVTELGVRMYNDMFEKRTDPRGRHYYWLYGHPVEEGEADTTDVVAVAHKKVSITPVTFNMTDTKTLKKLEHLKSLESIVDSGTGKGTQVSV